MRIKTLVVVLLLLGCRRCVESVKKLDLARYASELVPLNNAWRGDLSTLKDISPLVVFANEDLTVLYKPPAILVQSGKEEADDNDNTPDDDVNLLDAISQATGQQHYLVHRLDRPVSGLVIFGKNKQAAGTLTKAFVDQRVTKSYVAMTNSAPQLAQQTNLLLHLDISQAAKTRVVTQGQGGIEARLSYTTLHVTLFQQALLDIQLGTGRKHQIRATLSHLHCPIVGDSKYGAKQRLKCREIALHAYRLAVPYNNEMLDFFAPPPSSWHKRFGLEVIEAIEALRHLHK